MWLDLSLAYGRPVKELQEELSQKDLMEMMAYQNIRGPIGPDRIDQLFAFLYSAFCAAHGAGNVQFPDWWHVGGSKKLTVEQASASLVSMGLAKKPGAE